MFSDNRAILSLNLASNNLGAPLLPDFWTYHPGIEAAYRFMHANGSHQEAAPAGTSYPVAIAIANAIKDMGAISSVNLLKNGISMEQAKALASVLMEHPTLKSLCGNSGNETELDMSSKEIGAEGAVMLAPEIAGNGALLVLSLKDNRLATKESGKALAQALASNSTLKELDVSSNNWMEYGTYGRFMGDGPGFAQELAVGIKDNGALSVLNLASNGIGEMVLPDGWRKTESGRKPEWTHSDGSKVTANPGKPEGVIALATAIPDMRALTKLNISGNYIGAEQERDLQCICVAGGIELAK
jgi:hypothetical protein